MDPRAESSELILSTQRTVFLLFPFPIIMFFLFSFIFYKTGEKSELDWGEVTHFSTKVQNCLWKVHLRVPAGPPRGGGPGKPLPESPSERAGVHSGSGPQDGRIGLLQPLPRRGTSKQLRLYRGTEEEGACPVGQGPGDRGRGHPGGSPGASGQVDHWEVEGSSPSPSFPCRYSSKRQWRSPHKARATFWRLQEQPLGPQSPIHLGPAVRPQARGSMSLSWQGIGPDCFPFVKK